MAPKHNKKKKKKKKKTRKRIFVVETSESEAEDGDTGDASLQEQENPAVPSKNSLPQFTKRRQVRCPECQKLKPQLHWASLLAARWRVYNLLVNSPSVIMPASKLAACKKAASKVVHVQLLLATRWLVRVFVQCNRSF